jgi:hypothetical protein
MNVFARGALAATLTILVVAPVAAQPNDACSRDRLVVDGTPVDVTLCVADATGGHRAKGEGKPVSVTVNEIFSSGGNSFTRSTVLDFLERRETSRTIDDVPLAQIGVQKSLHLTIGYRDGTVRLEHAMLVPGAVNLK